MFTVFENSEKYVITNKERNIFLSISKIKGNGEIIRIRVDDTSNDTVKDTLNGTMNGVKNNLNNTMNDTLKNNLNDTMNGKKDNRDTKDNCDKIESRNRSENKSTTKNENIKDNGDLEDIIKDNGDLEDNINNDNESYVKHFFQSNIFHSSFDILSIYGLINFENQTFLIFITEHELICKYSNYFIYKIKNIKIKNILTNQNNSYLYKRIFDYFKNDGIYYTITKNENISFNGDNEYLFNYELLNNFLGMFEEKNNFICDNKVLENNDDLSTDENTQKENISYSIVNEKRSECLLEKYSFLDNFLAKIIYGSFEYFTICEHKFCESRKNCIFLGIEPEEKKSFFSYFRRTKKKDSDSTINDKDSRNNSIKTSEIDQDLYFKNISPFFIVILLSRRSHQNMGVRFLRRGIREGYPTNAVETEQMIVKNEVVKKESLGPDTLNNNTYTVDIAVNNYKSEIGDSKNNKKESFIITKLSLNKKKLESDNQNSNSHQFLVTSTVLSSFLQLRGSIPLLWKQELTFKYTPFIKFVKSDEPLIDYDSYLKNKYKNVFYLNLIKGKGDEGFINSFYNKCLQDNNIKYLHYDFKKEQVHTSGRKRRELLGLLRPILRRQKIYSINSNKNNTYKNSRMNYKNGVYNKCSSLSMTNKFRNDINKEIINITKQQGLIRTNCIDSLDRTNVAQFLIADEIMKEILKMDEDNYKKYRKIWIENGHRLSRQYSGTGSLGSEVLSEKTGIMNKIKDGHYSIVRYFINRFFHGNLQTSYDIITGHNVNMVKRETKNYKLLHFFICIGSVLFYLYYYTFYYGSDNFDRPFRDILKKIYFYDFKNIEIKNFIRDIIPTSFYDVAFVFVLTCFLTCILHPIICGMCFSHPYYE